ncbi:hypothetical protein [Pedobacter sp.]
MMKYIFTVIYALLSFTLSAQTIKSTAKGGYWTEGSTWEGGIVPVKTDKILIAPGAVVTISQATICSDLEIAGSVKFDAGILVVNGNLLVVRGGSFMPYAGGSISFAINGNFTNDGTVDLSRMGTVMRMGKPGGNAEKTSFGGSGIFIKGVVRTLRIDNPQGVTLQVPITISAELGLLQGKFSTNDNLTVDNTSVGNGKPTEAVNILKKSGSFDGDYKKGTKANVSEQ